MELLTTSFDKMFLAATGKRPFPYQRKFAEGERLPELIEAPTGAGKTAAAILGWLWRRRYAPESIRKATPRRLVYSLPIRVLVEQTSDWAVLWLHNLGLLAHVASVVPQNGEMPVADYEPSWDDPGRIAVSVLMGGEERRDWDMWPERDAVIIGTQDMLLSRALNRGYGMSRYRWPMHFALLNNDCLWVFDEIQLMGSGLATTTQLAAFRDKLKSFGTCSCVWMSATLRKDWLGTIDFRDEVPRLSSCQLGADDLANEELNRRHNAGKQLKRCAFNADKAEEIAQVVVDKHQAGSLTLAVVNTVERATRLFGQITAKCQGVESLPEVLLLHSRFRPGDRQKQIRKLLTKPGAAGLIAVSTQVVEAGVDVSARTLFTELAPWPSLVQRFGRCNRYGEHQDAIVYWIDIPKPVRKGDKDSEVLPYERERLETARKHLCQLPDAGPAALQAHLDSLGETEQKELFPYSPRHVVRRKDVVELFDTTPDLAGNDIDVSRFIRDGQDLDVQVFWRSVEIPSPDDDSGKAARREELCPVPFIHFREFLKKKRAYRWDYLDRRWVQVLSDTVFPGQVYLVPADQGGYSPELGWDAESSDPVGTLPGSKWAPDDNDNNRVDAQGPWQTISEHTQDVLAEMKTILHALGLSDISIYIDTINSAALWHDRGKAHSIFQGALPDSPPRPDQWAKAPGTFREFRRLLDGGVVSAGIQARGFRHELASALAMLQAGKTDLCCYLAATHHGKVRLSIRSLPHEQRPRDPAKRFARGIWDGDRLPPTDLGGETAPGVKLSLGPMELGLSKDLKPSWAERMLMVRDDLGPFRLAFMEVLLRAADMRASAASEAKTTLREESHA